MRWPQGYRGRNNEGGGGWLTGFRWEPPCAGRRKEEEGGREGERNGQRRVMPGDFIGDVSIATARLIRHYELLLAA